MAHYAFLNAENIVVNVIVGRDEGGGTDWEAYYSAKTGLACKRTSYNTRAGVHSQGGVPFRKNYASKGFRYDAGRDAFIPPRPHPSWTLDETTCTWAPPSPRPSGDGLWSWDESAGEWVDLRALRAG
jgi:hypothetical protein